MLNTVQLQVFGGWLGQSLQHGWRGFHQVSDKVGPAAAVERLVASDYQQFPRRDESSVVSRPLPPVLPWTTVGR